jgi:hypothetical protein
LHVAQAPRDDTFARVFDGSAMLALEPKGKALHAAVKTAA